ncbi:hypothetical protein QJQ45_023501 [Haematococcus lacustris]|nr:hypothetical protein QJQ45_023501 [Haematococcus lacustris]
MTTEQESVLQAEVTESTPGRAKRDRKQGPGTKLGDIPNVVSVRHLVSLLWRVMLHLLPLALGPQFSGFPAEEEKNKDKIHDRLAKWSNNLLHAALDAFDMPRGSGEEAKKESKVSRLMDFLTAPQQLSDKDIAAIEAKKKEAAKRKREKAKQGKSSTAASGKVTQPSPCMFHALHVLRTRCFVAMQKVTPAKTKKSKAAKEEEQDEDEEDEEMEEEEEEAPATKSKGKGKRKSDEDSEDENGDDEDEDEEEEDEPKKKRARATPKAAPAKKASSNAAASGKKTPGRRPRGSTAGDKAEDDKKDEQGDSANDDDMQDAEDSKSVASKTGTKGRTARTPKAAASGKKGRKSKAGKAIEADKEEGDGQEAGGLGEDGAAASTAEGAGQEGTAEAPAADAAAKEGGAADNASTPPLHPSTDEELEAAVREILEGVDLASFSIRTLMSKLGERYNMKADASWWSAKKAFIKEIAVDKVQAMTEGTPAAEEADVVEVEQPAAQGTEAEDTATAGADKPDIEAPSVEPGLTQQEEGLTAEGNAAEAEPAAEAEDDPAAETEPAAKAEPAADVTSEGDGLAKEVEQPVSTEEVVGEVAA